MAAINLQALPKEVRDLIELKEATDQTFHRFCDESYSEIFWNILAERADPGIEHSFIGSCYGQQGSGKCLKCTTYITTTKGNKQIKDLVVGDELYNENGEIISVKNKWFSKKKCLDLKLDFANDVCLSETHKLSTARGIVQAKDLVLGDFIEVSVPRIFSRGSIRNYERAFVFGAFIADGSIHLSQRFIESKRKPGTTRSNGSSAMFGISNNNKKYLIKLKKYIDENFNFISCTVLAASGKGRWLLKGYGIDEIKVFVELCGKTSVDKKVPVEVFKTKEGVRGFLDGYCNGDMTCNIVKQKKKDSPITEVGWLIKSESAALSILDALHIEGFWPLVVVRTLKSGKYKGNKYYRMTLPAKSVIDFFDSRLFINDHKLKRVELVQNRREKNASGNSYNTIKGNKVVTTDKKIININDKYYAKITQIKSVGVVDCTDIEVSGQSHLFQLAGGVVSHNSYLALSICCFLDPNFSVDNIFFDYNDLVYNRHKLKPNSAVLVDEQSQAYGLDSHRIMVILSSLKEQLRKKSIHFIFCAPVLYEEHKSSMYLIETMFINYETKMAVAALKTRDGLTLGHIEVPHPLKINEDGTSLASPALLAAYQAKKDKHLEKVLGNKNVDVFEERAIQIMKTKLFKKAESIYIRKMGYIPQSTLIQLINKTYPEYNAGVVPLEIAGRIKLDREISGKWDISGQRRTKGGIRGKK